MDDDNYSVSDDDILKLEYGQQDIMNINIILFHGQLVKVLGFGGSDLTCKLESSQ